VHLDWDAPLDTIPIFVKAGAIIPMAPVMNYVGEKPWDPITVEIYPEGKSSFTMYDSDDEVKFSSDQRKDGTVVITVNSTERPRSYEFCVHKRSQASSVSANRKALSEVKNKKGLVGTKQGWTHNARMGITTVKISDITKCKVALQ